MIIEELNNGLNPLFIDTLEMRLSRSNRLLVRLVQELIHRRYQHDIKIFEIASSVGVSPWHLNRVFKRATGKSLHQYLIEVRVRTAQSLIQTTKLPLKEVALRVGFTDQSHLTRHFKRLLKLTPGEYIREQCDGAEMN